MDCSLHEFGNRNLRSTLEENLIAQSQTSPILLKSIISYFGILCNETYNTIMPMNKRIITKKERKLLVCLLKEARENSGLRQIDLANRLGKNQSYISKYETGEKILDFIEVRLICQAIGISFVDFVQDYERKLI